MNAEEKATAPLPAAVPDERATVPLPGDDSATAPLHPKPDTLGRFVVRGWLGSGAFGDVYRAHDPQLDREVALKVAKPGSLNTPERLARFLREAKAAANLRHPNIVPLYETGQDGERRFIASAFIAGKTLEAVIEEAYGERRDVSPPVPGLEGERRDVSPPVPGLPLAQVADLGRKLADALAYAHSQGVVHRDVKPANVLVDAAGEPHLLDFGLAAREEEGAERLTQDGQGMGTPAYMAPEQAEGKGIAASDQYSLGCALYELATGQTPFAGGSAQQMFLHRTQPVPSPRSLRKDIPKDLDTLILKCLEKEPARRYADCSELADDLRRFASGEPVKVRRAGPVERFTRWTKRNKRLAGMGALVLLTMALGTAVSLGFGLYANKKAGEALTQKSKADEKTVDATREAKRANDETEKTQKTLARALLGPIVPYDPEVGWDRPLSVYERNALWSLAESRNGPVGRMLVEEATATPLAAAQFRSRAAFLLHAAVGLDSARRVEAGVLIARQLRDARLPLELKRDVAMTSADGGLDGGATAETAEVLVAALGRAMDKHERAVLAEGLVAVCGRLPADRGADVLVAALRAGAFGEERRALAAGLAAVCGRLSADKAAEACGQAADVLVAALGRETSYHERRALAAGLVAVCGRLPADKAAEACGQAADVLVAALEQTADDSERRSLAAGLTVVCGRLTADKVTTVARSLLTSLREAEFESARELAAGLVAVCERLPADKAAEACGQAADVLVVSLRQTHKYESVRRELAVGLAAVCGRLPADKAAEACGQAADVLVAALGRETSYHERLSLVEGLVATCGCLPAGQGMDLLVAALGSAKFVHERKALAAGLAAVCGRPPAGYAAEAYGRGADVLIAALSRATDYYERRDLAAGLAAVCGRLPADQGVDLLATALGTAKLPVEQRELVAGLATIASGLSSAFLTHRKHPEAFAALTGVTTLHSDVLPKPRPLPAEQLVELLKHPFCVKEARRAVLDALEFTYDRQFADLWEFVAFAEKEHPELDLLTPPKRPEKAEKK